VIAIIDYDIGNITAVSNMLSRIGLQSQITSLAEDVERADRIILPGNGSFDACMKNLRATGLIPVLEHKVLEQHTPLLGLGSEEGVEQGLGWLDMEVLRFPDMPDLRVPHMGWNHVRSTSPEHKLTREMANDARFYFVHSYYMQPKYSSDILMSATYGIEFAAGVSRGNISGVQFHPEKSHRFGKQLLASFAGGL
jgi:glutamine amidotransferase